MDADTGRIVAAVLTDKDADDIAQVGPLLDQADGPIASLTGDGAYDQESVYGGVAERHPDASVIVPPRSTAVPSDTAETAPTQRNRHLQLIDDKGRMGWQKASGYRVGAKMPLPGLSGAAAERYGATPSSAGGPMPYRFNEPRRHKIPRARYRVQNWPEYDRALQRRGGLTGWVTPPAVAGWWPPPPGRRGRARGFSGA